jgi:hypothetical protein
MYLVAVLDKGHKASRIGTETIHKAYPQIASSELCRKVKTARTCFATVFVLLLVVIRIKCSYRVVIVMCVKTFSVIELFYHGMSCA